MFVILGLCSMVLVWWISGHNASEGEPYSWSDGISTWPTETLRLFAFLLSAFYLWKINKALWESERRVECNFALPKYSHSLARLSPEKSWWRRSIAAVTVRHWKCDKDNTIDASLLWMCYCDSGTQRARWLRIGPLIVCYI